MGFSLITDGWHIAIRSGYPGRILEDRKVPFTVKKNGLTYWVADPFLFRYKEDIYIFAEYMDYRDLKGCIAYAKLEDVKQTLKWKKVIVEPFHMSFPFIYNIDGEIFMIPETSQGNALFRYRCISFPDIWGRENLYDGIALADTALFNNYSRGYSLDVSDDNNRTAVLFDVTNNKITNFRKYSNDQRTCRLAGAFLELTDKTVKVSQDCSKEYGEKLVFSNWKDKDEKENEVELVSIDKNDINLVGTKIRVDGIHTYNCAGDYEIIDIKTDRINIIEVAFRVLRKLFRLYKRK